jgi:hypothetical protein
MSIFQISWRPRINGDEARPLVGDARKGGPNIRDSRSSSSTTTESGLVLPSATQRAVKLDDRKKLIESGLNEGIFGGEKLLLLL